MVGGSWSALPGAARIYTEADKEITLRVGNAGRRPVIIAAWLFENPGREKFEA